MKNCDSENNKKKNINKKTDNKAKKDIDSIEIGKEGEKIALKYLQEKGYLILKNNYRTRYGEIDLICKEKNTIIFVEVKLRNNFNYIQAAESISPSKIKKIRKTAELYIQEIGENTYEYRFDVIIILNNKNSNKIFHLENAF